MWDKILKFLNDNKDALGWLFGSGVVLAVLGGIYRIIVWLIKEYRLRKIRTNENFPFKIIPPNSNVAREVLGGADDDPLADRNIPYQQRIQGRNTRRELEELIEDNRWILITGRTGLGKTREAVQLAQSLNNEGWMILYLTREAWLDAPAKLPKDVPDRKLLFFLDDLNKKCFSGKAEIRPDASESLTLPIFEPFQTRLHRTLEAFDAFCGKSEIRVIATARNENTSEFDEPSEWDKLEWVKHSNLWEAFKLFDLLEPDEKSEQQLLVDTSEKANVYINSNEIASLAKRNDGTFRNLVENLSSAKTEGSELSLENFRDTLKGTWQRRYEKAIKKYPEAIHIYDAIELLREVGLHLNSSIVIQVAKVISKEKLLQRLKRKYPQVLNWLMKNENLLHPRDGQIEAKNYRINVEEWLPRVYKQIYSGLEKNSLSFSLRLSRIIGSLTLSLTPKSIFLLSTKLGRIEKTYCSLLDLHYTIGELAEHYAKTGFEQYAENLILKLVEITDTGPFNRTFNKKHNSYTWLRLGYFYSNLDRFDNAIQALERAASLDPKSAYPWNGLGNIYRKQERYEDAIIAYQKAIELNPKLAYPWDGLGDIYKQQERYEDAITAYQKAIELNPKSAYPWDGLGDTYRQQRRYEDAITAYQKAIEIDPKSAYPWNGLGKTYRQQKRYEDAITAYHKAIDLDPKLVHPWNGLGDVYGQQEKHDNAIIAYQRAIELDPKLAYPWNGLGDVYGQQEKHDDAIIAYRRAIELDPKNPFLWHDLGYGYRNFGLNYEAIKTFHEVIKLDPQNAELWNGLGNSYYDLGNYEEAFKAYNRAIELRPNNGLFWGNLGILYLRNDKTDNAIEAFQKSIDVDSKYAYSFLSLAFCYKKAGDRVNANKLIDSVESIINDEGEYVQACFHVWKGNIESGLLSLKRGLDKQQTSKAWAQYDPNFEIIRHDSRFKEIVGLE